MNTTFEKPATSQVVSPGISRAGLMRTMLVRVKCPYWVIKRGELYWTIMGVVPSLSNAVRYGSKQLAQEAVEMFCDPRHRETTRIVKIISKKRILTQVLLMVIKDLIKSHTDADSRRFYEIATRLMEGVDRIGHREFAQELREGIVHAVLATEIRND